MAFLFLGIPSDQAFRYIFFSEGCRCNLNAVS